MTSLNLRWTYAGRRGDDPKLFLGNDRSPGLLRGADDNPKVTGRMLRGGGTTLNSSSGTTVQNGLLKGADDFPKPRWVVC